MTGESSLRYSPQSVCLSILSRLRLKSFKYSTGLFNITACFFRFGQFLVSTLPAHPANENELKLDAVSTTETNPEGGEAEESLSPRRICLRNVMLELILCLIYAEGGELDHR